MSNIKGSSERHSTIKMCHTNTRTHRTRKHDTDAKGTNIANKLFCRELISILINKFNLVKFWDLMCCDNYQYSNKSPTCSSWYTDICFPTIVFRGRQKVFPLIYHPDIRSLMQLLSWTIRGGKSIRGLLPAPAKIV